MAAKTAELGARQEARLVRRQRGEHAQTRSHQHEASAPLQSSLELTRKLTFFKGKTNGGKLEARLVGRQRGEHAQTRTQIDFFT
jgi:hypothetical protein